MLVTAALAAFLFHVHELPRAPVDDAGISVAYARSVAAGAGLRVTPESAVAEGFSNPSWTAMLALLELLGRDSLAWARPLGVAFAALALGLVALWGPIAERRRLQLEDALAPWLAAMHPSFVHWAQGGLETGLLVASIALLGVFTLGPHTRGRAVLAGLSAALVMLTRPEGALYVAAVGSAWPVAMWTQGRRPARSELAGLLCAALPVLAYLVFRRVYFGEWVPNTYLAKRQWDFLNLKGHFGSFWASYHTFCTVTMLALPLAILGGARTLWRSGTCYALLGAFAYFTYHARGDWMMEWRFLAPAAPFQAGAIACGVAGFRRSVARVLPLFTQRRYAAPLPLAATIALAVPVASHVISRELARETIVRRRGSDVPITIAKGETFAPAEQLLGAFRMTHPLVLASDMGVIALGLRHGELWDFAGLTDPAMARLYGNPRAFEDYMTHEGPPSLVLAWGPGNFFPLLAYASERYDEVEPGRFVLKGLAPAEDPRCPDGKDATLSVSSARIEELIRSDLTSGRPVRALARWRCAHSYREDAQLPSLERRAALARLAEELARRDRQSLELALRYDSACAVIGIHDAALTVPCRKRAEALRAALFKPIPAIKTTKRSRASSKAPALAPKP